MTPKSASLISYGLTAAILFLPVTKACALFCPGLGDYIPLSELSWLDILVSYACVGVMGKIVFVIWDKLVWQAIEGYANAPVIVDEIHVEKIELEEVLMLPAPDPAEQIGLASCLLPQSHSALPQ